MLDSARLLNMVNLQGIMLIVSEDQLTPSGYVYNWSCMVYLKIIDFNISHELRDDKKKKSIICFFFFLDYYLLRHEM